jgi:hypothetical protein
MKTPSIATWTWAVAVAAVLCSVWLAASESSGPEQGLPRFFQDVPSALFPSAR